MISECPSKAMRIERRTKNTSCQTHFQSSSIFRAQTKIHTYFIGSQCISMQHDLYRFCLRILCLLVAISFKHFALLHLMTPEYLNKDFTALDFHLVFFFFFNFSLCSQNIIHSNLIQIKVFPLYQPDELACFVAQKLCQLGNIMKLKNALIPYMTFKFY